MHMTGSDDSGSYITEEGSSFDTASESQYENMPIQIYWKFYHQNKNQI